MEPKDQSAGPDIAIGIVCRNEADDLDSCLASVPWATEVYVLNMGSTDHTLQVAAKFGATVIDVPDVPVAERVRNRYLDVYRSAWMLQLDCDERIPDGWLEAIRPILATAEPTDIAAFVLPFRLFALDVPLDHGMGTNGSVRLFRRGRVRYNDDQAAHRNPILDGRLEDLTGRVPPVDHYSIRTIDGYLEKVIRYARTESKELRREDLDPLVTLREFYRWTLVERGWRDGFAGVAMATTIAFSRGLAHIYAWERLGGGPVPIRGRRGPITDGESFGRELIRLRTEVVLDKVYAAQSPGVSLAEAMRHDRFLLLRPLGAKTALSVGASRIRQWRSTR